MSRTKDNIKVPKDLIGVVGIEEFLDAANLLGFTICQAAALLEKLKGKNLGIPQMLTILLSLAPSALEFQSKALAISKSGIKKEWADLAINEAREVALAGLTSSSCIKGPIHELITATINYIADTAIAGKKAYMDGQQLLVAWSTIFSSAPSVD